MAKRGSLAEFQTYLADRLSQFGERPAAGLLGVRSGHDYWLLDLTDSGEVIASPPLTPVPLTRPWFAGLTNIRGTLYAVTDFSAFRGAAAAPAAAQAWLLLIGARHGSNAALRVDETLGLRNVANLSPAPTDPDPPPWTPHAFTDNEHRYWRMLDVPALLADERFSDPSL